MNTLKDKYIKHTLNKFKVLGIEPMESVLVVELAEYSNLDKVIFSCLDVRLNNIQDFCIKRFYSDDLNNQLIIYVFRISYYTESEIIPIKDCYVDIYHIDNLIREEKIKRILDDDE